MKMWCYVFILHLIAVNSERLRDSLFFHSFSNLTKFEDFILIRMKWYRVVPSNIAFCIAENLLLSNKSQNLNQIYF